MVSSVYWEWELLIIAIKLGVKLTLLYDVICMFRFLISHNDFFVSVEDFFFWFYAAVLVFELQLGQSDGVLRGFTVLGMFVGMFLYSKLIGEKLVNLAEKGIGFTKRQLTKRAKMFKIDLCKHCDVSRKNRRRYGKKKNSGKKEETEQSGNAAGNDGSIGNDVSSCSE